MKYIDNFLNGITMYKLVLYGLMLLCVLSIGLGFAGVLPYSGLSLVYSMFAITVVCYVSNYLLGELFSVQTNVESSSITAFILFFILSPIVSLPDLYMTLLVGFIAMASKYFLAIERKHIFNPAAVAVFIVGLFGSGIGSWWIGTTVLALPVAILGFLVLRKLKRFQMFFAFVFASLVSIFAFNFSYASGIVLEVLKITFLSAPILFFGTIMLTEPFTTPTTRNLRMVYAVIVGLLFGAQFEFGILYSTPGLALVLGNIFSYIVSPKGRLALTLIQKNQLSKDIYEFVWKSDSKLSFHSGQYLEWTLGHKKPDQRGNRRYFTIASSPTEENIKLGIKFYDNSSTFKKELLSLKSGATISAGALSGEFTLPEDPKRKLVFIAGGIGVTPFRSMIVNLLDVNQQRDIVLFFSNRTPNDIVYKNIFDQAERQIGLKTIYAVNDLAGVAPAPNMPVGFVDEKMIREYVPDFAERVFYISGPHGMITAFESTLSKMGVRSSQIKTDFFPGFV